MTSPNPHPHDSSRYLPEDYAGPSFEAPLITWTARCEVAGCDRDCLWESTKVNRAVGTCACELDGQAAA